MRWPNEDKFDGEIRAAAKNFQVPFELLKAQVAQESGFDPLAISECWAAGLLQLMPGTAREMGLIALDHHEGWSKEAYLGFMRDAKDERLSVPLNLEAGARYLRIQYDHFPEIPDEEECWKFGLAAYNGGRGHINNALKLSMRDCLSGGLHFDKWEHWDFTRRFLDHCDVLQICGYVTNIWRYYQEFKEKRVPA